MDFANPAQPVGAYATYTGITGQIVDTAEVGAYADFANRKVGSFASAASTNPPGFPNSHGGTAQAYLRDTIYFDVSGLDVGATVAVGYTVAYDGYLLHNAGDTGTVSHTISAAFYEPERANCSAYTIGFETVFCPPLDASGFSFTSSQTKNIFGTTLTGYGFQSPDIAVTNQSSTTSDPARTIVRGHFEITRFTDTQMISEMVFALTSRSDAFGGGIANFINTADFSFQVPDLLPWISNYALAVPTNMDVPEPAMLSLFGLGLVGLALRRRSIG